MSKEIVAYKGKPKYFNDLPEKVAMKAVMGKIEMSNGKKISCLKVGKEIYKPDSNVLNSPYLIATYE